MRIETNGTHARGRVTWIEPSRHYGRFIAIGSPEFAAHVRNSPADVIIELHRDDAGELLIAIGKALGTFRKSLKGHQRHIIRSPRGVTLDAHDGSQAGSGTAPRALTPAFRIREAG